MAATLVIFGLPLGESLRLIVDGAAGDKFGIARTLIAAIPLILASLGIVIAWRAGMYNIGGEGQYIVGGLTGAVIASMVPGLPPQALNLAILFSGIVGGALYGALAGWLQVHRGVQVVISTILMNFIALQLLSWAVTGPLQEPNRALPQTAALPTGAMLMRFDPQTDLHAGIFIAVLAAVAVYVYLFRTRRGFELRVVGENPRAARANLINAPRTQIFAMLISGGLCGLAGAVQYTGVQRELSMSFSEQWGFIAIPVALLGMLHPLGIVLSSLYFGALMAGAKNLERFTPGASAMVYVIQALAVLALLTVQTLALRRRIREEAA
ncbi:MAG: ABC transporter permease [Fimbriimonadaceae bacterium]